MGKGGSTCFFGALERVNFSTTIGVIFVYRGWRERGRKRKIGERHFVCLFVFP